MYAARDRMSAAKIPNETHGEASWSVPLDAALVERFERARTKVTSLVRLARGWKDDADVDILGSYNTSNVGDLAFSLCLGHAASAAELRARIQDYSRYRRSRHAARLVIGGGGVIGPQNQGLQRCAEHRASFGSAVAVVGVSGALAPDDVTPALKRLLRQARFVSARDQKTRNNLEQILERSVVLQPDIAFALLRRFPELAQLERSAARETVGLNVTPVLARKAGHRYVPNPAPSPWFAARIPDVAAVYPQVAPAYVALVRDSVRRHLAAGRRVVAVPFAAEDATFARAILGDTGAELAAFNPDPLVALARVASCSAFIATRFHAHIFALLARVPLLPLAYSEKCSLLVSELFPGHQSPGPIDWVRDPEKCVRSLDNGAAGLRLDDEAWRAVQAKSDAALRDAMAAVKA
jgi:polysaccharide pyruvyl transferase WcaK-like protein